MASKAQKKDLLKEALALPLDQRAALAHELIASMDEPFDDPKEVADAWRAEIETRWTQVESGEAKLENWMEVRARISAQLKR